MARPADESIAGAYAADALGRAERERFDAHLGECDDCRLEVEGLRAAAAALAEATATRSPPDLRNRVMAHITTVRPLPPIVTPATRRTRRRVVGLGSVAAALVLTLGLAVTRSWSHDGGPPGPAQQVLQADDALRSSVDLGGGARATVVRSGSLGRAVVRTEDMAPSPAGRVYQLWYSVDGRSTPAGLLPDAAGDQTVGLRGDPRQASAVTITVEPTGGSRTPTGRTVATFDFGPAG